MKILLYEYVSGGGFVDQPLPSSLLCEGFAMLKGLTSDFKNSGHDVTIMLDHRVAKFNPHLDVKNEIIVHSNSEQKLLTILREFEAAYVIAPESNHILKSIVKSIEDNGVLSLNCQSEGIAQTSDKAIMLKHAESLGLNVPETLFFKTSDLAKNERALKKELGFPIIIKPANGAGCSGLSVVRNTKQLPKAIRKIKNESLDPQILVQKFIDGIPTSVSLISNGSEAIPISLNRQYVKIATPDSISYYNGGVVPLDNHLKEQAFAVAKRVVESVKGLRGYIGVDFILSNDKVFFIEINPRLTTSYVGLRGIINFNLFQAIFNSILRHELPEKVQNKGYSCFSKVSISHSSLDIYQEACKIPGVISPPFPIEGDDASYALVESHGYTSNEAEAKSNETKMRLKQLNIGDK